MLRALYDYGIRNGLAIPPGFAKKPIRAYIVLSENGTYVGIEKCENENLICPDIGSAAQGPDKCHPLAEKMKIIFNGVSGSDDSAKKFHCFCELLAHGAESIPQLSLCLNVMLTEELMRSIYEEACREKLKDDDRISFKVGVTPIASLDGVEAWWSEYRKRFSKSDDKKDGAKAPCLITGEGVTPLETVPTVTGLQAVGGHSKGEALFCFDKAAFQSYGLKKTANAPVSEDAFGVVKDALNDLLAGAPAMYSRDISSGRRPSAPVFSGMKFVHWYDCSIEEKDDTLADIFGTFIDGNEEVSGEAAEASGDVADEKERLSARQKADRLVRSLQSGEGAPVLNCSYHILLISGANGRAMVRRYESGSYEKLRESLELWKKDIRLCNDSGTGDVKPCRFTARLFRLVKPSAKSDQLKKELSGLTPSIIMAIVNGRALPDAVASRALAYIRSQLYDSQDDKKMFVPDGIACQWLKAWLARRGTRNEEVSNMSVYNSSFPNAAYHCGAITALYAMLQRAAMGELNAGLVERYYTSASRTPSLVLGTLERMAGVYLSKLEGNGRAGIARIYEDRLNEAYSFFASDPEKCLPTTLNLEQQSYFALGYRQMCAEINADIINRKAKNTEEE